VPRGVIEASANIVGEAESVQSIAIHYPVSDIFVPLRRGRSPPFYRPRRG
jgi:hypothetical protein